MIGFLGESKLSGLIWKVIMVLAILSFVAGGMFVGTIGLSSNKHYIAKINTTEISEAEFKFELDNQIRQNRAAYGAKFDELQEDPTFKKNLTLSVLNNLLDNMLVKEYSKDLGYTVSDLDIKNAIVNDQTFSVDGKFNNDSYLNFLKNNNINSDMFAERIRLILLKSKLKNIISETSFVVPKTSDHEKALLTRNFYVRLAKLNLKDLINQQTVTNDEIDSYYKDNQTKFVANEQIQLQYLDVDKRNFPKETVNDILISQYYQDNKEKYSIPANRKFSIISVADKTIADKVYSELKEGADFAELAKIKSEDTITASSGGDISWNENFSIPELQKAAQELKNVGDYTKPFLLDKTYNILKLTDRKDTQTKSLSEVKEEIKNMLEEDTRSKKYYSLSSKLSDEINKKEKTLEDIAKIYNLEIKQTNLFTKENPPQELNNLDLLRSLFSKQTNNSSNALNFAQLEDEHSIFYKVSQHQEEHVKTKEEVKNEIISQLKIQKADKEAEKKGRNIVASLDKEGESVVKSYNISFGNSEQYNLITSPPSAVSGAIFTMKTPNDGKKSYGYVLDNDDLTIIALDKVENKELENNVSEQIATSINNAQKQSFDQAFSQSLREIYKPEINNNLLNTYFQDSATEE